MIIKYKNNNKNKKTSVAFKEPIVERQIKEAMANKKKSITFQVTAQRAVTSTKNKK